MISASVKGPPAKRQPALIPSCVGTPGKVVRLHRAAEWTCQPVDCRSQPSAQKRATSMWDGPYCLAWQAGWQPAKRPPLQMGADMGSTCQPGMLQGAAPAWLQPHLSCSWQYTSRAHPSAACGVAPGNQRVQAGPDASGSGRCQAAANCNSCRRWQWQIWLQLLSNSGFCAEGLG